LKLKASWLVTVLLLLSIATMIGPVVTSGYIQPQVTLTFFHSLTYFPSFTFPFTTAASSTHIFTFLPSFTFIFPTTTGPTATLPNATMIQRTDWTVLGIGVFPPNPQPGDQLVFSMTFAALSTNAPFPQSVYVQCQIDGYGCGAGSIPYTGPVGIAQTITANSYWPATPGPHVLTWFVDTNQDPNPGNNVLSVQFFVQPQQPPTTVLPPTQTTQITVAPPTTQPPSTIVQTSVQTVTQSPTQSTSSSIFGGQDYTLPLAIIAIVLVLALALSMRKRKTQPAGPQPGSWFCTNCGAPNVASSNFCSKCGTAKPKV